MTDHDDMSDRGDTMVPSTDIAIVGMSGRFPGAADVAGLWANIRAGLSGLTRFTDDELRAAGVPSELLEDPGYVKTGAVLDGIELFDANFFGVNPKEAQILDPQHRLFLEHSWEALEDAGCDPTRFDGAIGVIAGSSWSSYLQNNLSPSGIAASMGELAVGLANDKDSLTTRVAHTLGLTGPSYAVQSYCSTSLVAVCAAASSLANFESDLVLAGGVNVAVPHRVGYLYQQGGIAPPDGECRAFDAAGLGSLVGSGVGVVALRRLEDAIADGDRVYAVIRGWAVNNDGGRKVGFTAPGVQGQAAVIAEALACADLTPADIDYIEAHGTGTALGDAAELAAMQQVFRDQSVKIGSVKTNVGHLDRAAGVTNLIKTALALRNEEIPPSRNLTEPNRQLSTGDARLEVVTSLTAWPREEIRVRRAGVSAFGIGGTNAHVVVEEAPLVSRPAPRPRPELLVWSARSADAADAMTTRLADYLETGAERLSDIAYTLQTGRQVFEHRRAIVASTADSVVECLRDSATLGRTDGRADRDVALLIAGTGEQYPGMAADLYETEPVFRAVLDECRMVLVERLGLDPLEEMLSPREAGDGAGLSWLLGREGDTTPGAGESTDRLQPAMFAVEYALARLLESWGVRPAVLAGYSVGEYVAAALAGVLSLPDALALVARRAQLINAMPGGAMAAIPKSAADVRDLIARAGVTGIDIAAVNGPDLTVVAGEPEAMSRFRTFLEGEAVPSRPLATTHAFHSAMLEPIRAGLTEWVAANVTLNAPEIPYISNVTGTLATADQVTDPGYWAEHMCAPVQFDAVLSTLLEQGDLALLEIGPGQSLGAMVRGHRDCPQDRWPLVVPTIPAAGDPRQASVVLAEAVGRLWLAGVPIDWAGYQDDRAVGKVGLPTYPFQKQRYWIDPPIGQAAVAAVSANLLAGELDEPVDHVRLMTPQWTDTALTGDLVPLERCVLLADATGVADVLAESLRADKVDVVVLRDEHALAETDEIPTTLVDLRLLDRDESVADPAEGEVRGVSESPQSDKDGRDVVAPIAAMLDAWGSQGGNTRVILVTRGGQAVTTAESPVPAHAAAAGLPVVANQEYLNLECRTVDLDPAATPEASAKALAAEVRRPADDVLAGYRDGVRFVRGYAPTESDQPGTPIRRGGTYLVTGGLGDVGLILAEHLATAGAGKLILTSRGGIPTGIGDRRSDGVARLRALGAEVLTPAVDVTDAHAMAAMLTETLAGGRLDGVVHAAAVTGPETFRALRDIDTETVDWHFGAKVAGALALADVLAELPTEQAPDFCVVFSSTSSILGGITFGSYAAANAALSAVGHANHARFAAGESPTCWIAASWDTWSITLERMQVGVGAAMVAHSMSTEEGLQAFDRLLTERQPNLVVAAGGLDDRLPRAAAMLDTTVGAADRFPRPDLAQSYAPPLTRTERSLAELWTDVIGVEPVGIKDAFFDLGGNSLLALQMLALVKKRFGVSLPAVTLFEAPTVHTLAAILDQHGVAAPASTTPAATLVRARQEPDDDRRIAVIGMAGRFPGAPDVRTFWNNIRGGVESISFFTDEELLASGVTREEFSDPSYVRARPVLDNVSDFDAGFFGMNPRMAAVTDPQQRMFLEVCWEALEQAGYVTPKHRGRVGVYGGANISTYLLQNPASLTDGQFSIYEVIMGNDKDALTTTVSYLLDLYGPSVAVQTFCSTSLVAIHLAIQSLRSGESEMAIAGGVSIRVPDKIGHEHMPGGMESPDGHVRTFDAQAQGSMFGDGAAAVVLKRLSDAIRDGDHIWSVIRGSAMNNDGALKVGYTAPSVVGQSRVIIDAMADAGVTGDDVSYIEAHGTATELGDPIEVTALTRAFGDTKEKQFCPIGSVKTNVGHLDRAAGVTGLIKTSLALWDKVIPPSLHYTAPNPKIDFANSPFYVNTELSPWPERGGRPPIAGINSLGMGGTNVHLVVEQAPERALATPADPDSARRYHVLPVSARSAVAADEALAQLGAHLGSTSDTRLADVAYTLQVGRKTFEHRRALVSADIEEAATALADGEVLGRVDTTTGRPVAFVFSGVGEQYPGLVNQLYQREPVFRGVLDDCIARLAETLPDVDLTDLLTGERGAGANLAALLGRGDDSTDERVSTLERTEVVQPALFAVEYALAKTLMTWGMQPQVMLGYSLGEYVAACLSGVLSLPDALALVAHRAKLIDTVDAGSMVAVPMPVAELEQFGLAERGLDISAVNGPQMTVVAGPVDAVDAFVAELREAEIPCRPLQTTHAFHTRMLDGISGELTEWVKANITLNAPEIPYISNVTGTRVTTEQATNPAYWARHMCQTVKFTAGIETLLADQELAIIEIGTGQSLGAMIRGAGAPPTRWPLILSTLPSANETRADDAVLTDLLARLWLNGVDLDWTVYHNRHEDSVDDVIQPNRIPLPTYPFQRQRYWMESSGRPALPAAGKAVVVEDEGPHVRVMRPDWTEAKIVGKPATLGTCVLYADTLGVADALAESLRAVGAEAVVVPSGALTAADHAALVRKHAAKTQNTVVDLRLLDHPESDVDGRDVVRPTAAMLDAWGSDGSGSARVIVVTRGGQVISEGDTPLPAQSAAAILQMVANLEYLNLECSTVDVSVDAAEAARALLAEIQRPEDVGDVLMAYRGGTRYVRGFAPVEPGSGKAGNHSVRKGGTYLITGGLGDLGLLIAEHFAKAGAGRLVLTSRGGVPTGIGDRRSDGVARLQELGAEVITPAVDVTDLDGMRAVIAGLLVDGGTLDGVVHAAAVTDPGTFRALREVDEEAVGLHFGAKVVGVRVLETLVGELTDEQAPDFCLLFSSTSAVLGGITFACYAASNAALAAIGYRNHMRYTAGQIPTCWISSSWDTWSVENGHGTLGAAMSKHAMTAEEALDALDKLLAEPGPWLVVAAGGLDERLPRAVTVSEVVSTGPKLPRPDLPQPYAPPVTATEKSLCELWSHLLGIEPIGIKDAFFDLGGNSLLGLQMLALVKKRFGIAVAAVTLFESPTVQALSLVLDPEGKSGKAAKNARTQPTVTARPERPAVELTDDRRIAVVGMAGRFPGAPDVAAFWDNLRGGVESIKVFSEEEMLASGVTPEEIANPAYVPARPVLDNVRGFDAAFFGMSPRMAAITDPQQRLFLEVCWEALEQSGYVVPEHRGRVGVFGGANLSTYLMRMPERLADGEFSTYEVIMGNDKDALTLTVSYLLDLYGPSVAVQTFCSTSLVATHMAIQALRNGECEMAMAGGVSVRVPDKIGHEFAAGGMESPDGHVRTFDAQARGSMFGDGAAVVVLKRLSDALRDGDHIWSVIRGSAMNNDGALKVGFTAPSVVGQSRVVVDAMADAGITGDDVSYIEAHGTATELGDPIEVAALTRAFGDTKDRQYCAIGSVKTNVGHLDRAAGVTGLIKTSLAIREQVIPPTLHFTSPNPQIDFENSPFYVNTELSPWPTLDGKPPIAGINSLGMGGTNVHVVVEQAPERPVPPPADPETSRRYQVVPVSARNNGAIEAACARLGSHLDGSDARLLDIAYTLQVGRKTFEHRRAVVADSVEAAKAMLDGDVAGLLGRVDTTTGRQVAFVFAGVGEQYPGLVNELYQREPVFRAVLDECVGHLADALPDVDLTDLLAGERGGGLDLAAMMGRAGAGTDPRVSTLERTEVVQPALFAVEYALAKTLMTWGLQPRVMLGYSLGEYVAACLSGVLSLPDALKLVAHRAKLIEALPGGAMAGVSLSVADLGAYGLQERGLDIATVNGPSMTVVAGPTEAMAAFVADLREAEVPCRELQTTHAFHSRMLNEISDELTTWVKDNITLNAPEIDYISNVTGTRVTAQQVTNPAYWARHMCQTVQFASGIATLLADEELVIVEIGPGQSLGAMIRGANCPPSRWPLILNTLPPAGDTRADDAVLTDCLARLWLTGVEIDWTTYHDRHNADADLATRPNRIPLPTYPFQRQDYWIEPPARGAVPQPGQIPAEATLEVLADLPKLPQEQWLHLPVWRQTAAPAAATEQPREWLVFTRDGAAEDVVEGLRKSVADTGATLRLVRPGTAYSVKENSHTLRPGNVDDTLALLRDLRSAGTPLERVVHLWTLGEESGDETVRLGLHTLVALARAAGELGMEGWSLDVASAGTQQVLPGDPANPHAATLTGPSMVIPLEYPTVSARLLDVDADLGPRAVKALVAELRRPFTDRIVALRHGRRWLPSYESMTAPSTVDSTVLRDGGVFLITGGLGGIGLAMAEQLAMDCGAKLVLFGRNGLPERETWPAILAGDTGDATLRRRVAGVFALLDLGAEVEIVAGDVSNAADVRRAVDVALERFGALNGVLHAAGVPGMGLMQFKQPEELDQVLAPKVAGTLAIAEALRIGEPDEVQLDFWVLFSSITSATGGGPGQVDYCSANAFLDAYAHQLAATGRTVLSVDWGEWIWNAWADGLAGYSETLQEFLLENRERIGIGFAEGWQSLLRALDCGEPRVVVSTQDFDTMVRFSSQFTLEAVMSSAMAEGGGTRHPRPDLVTLFQEPSGVTEETIAEMWCEALRLEQVGVLDNFFELGGNSLLGVNIVAALRKKFELDELPPHILYEAPTVASLAKVVEAAADGPAAAETANGDGGVRAQLRRSGLEAAGARRRGR